MTISGGKVYFDSEWHLCLRCSCHFTNPGPDRKITACPLCGSQRVEGSDPDITAHNPSNS